MSISVTESDDGAVVNIAIKGRFIFDMHRDFRDAYRNRPAAKTYVLDLAGTEYMDSSALGMLLLIREHVGADNDRVVIKDASPQIRKLLKMARFDRFFRMT